MKINGKEYVLKSASQGKRESIANKKYLMVRTYSAGVFAGYLKKRVGKEVTLQDARRIWSWQGAASLSQLAMEGTKEPSKCKFAMPVDEVLLLEAIEIIPITAKAKESIESVSEWKND